VVPPGYKFIAEGSASILYEANETAGDKGEPVFYNKVQVLNRDLSIRMITQFVRSRARERAAPKGGRAKRRAAAQAAEAAGFSASGAAAHEAWVSAAAAAAEARSLAGLAAEGSGAGAGVGEGGVSGEGNGGDGVGETSSAANPFDLLALSTAELDAKLRDEAATKGIRILDALAATGLRSIRYFKEIPGVKQVSARLGFVDGGNF
jgi:tRNA (guanine26-N2/guanine27-N2)-dimethyltransferase